MPTPKEKKPSVFDDLAASDQRPQFLRYESAQRVAYEFLYWLANDDWKSPLKNLQKKFEDKNLTAIFNSWVRRSETRAPFFSPKDVFNVLGEKTVADIARISGVGEPEMAGRLLTDVIPWVVKTLTPRHDLPSDVVASIGISSLRKGVLDPPSESRWEQNRNSYRALKSIIA